MMERGLNAVLTQVVSRNLFSEPTPRKPSTLPRKCNATPPQLPADSSGTRIRLLKRPLRAGRTDFRL
jgi:hypothetical protein